MVLYITPFQKGFPNFWNHGTLISCTVLGLVFHKTHSGKPCASYISYDRTGQRKTRKSNAGPFNHYGGTLNYFHLDH